MDRKATWRERAEKLVNRASQAFPTSEFENWSLCEELKLEEQGVKLSEQINKLEIETENAALLLAITANYLYQKGKYSNEAEPLFQRSFAIREKALGPDHPDVALSLNNLAVLYKAQGEYAQAEPLFQRSLAIREQALGPDHPDVAAVLENYAVCSESSIAKGSRGDTSLSHKNLWEGFK